MQKKRLQSETPIFAGALIPKLHDVKTSTQIYFFAVFFFLKNLGPFENPKTEKKKRKKKLA